MFTPPDSRLSASNSAVLASESFLVPVTLHSQARSSQAAFDGLQQSFDEVQKFASHLASTVPGLSLVAFDENVPPRVSQVKVLLDGKDYEYELTYALKCPIPKDADFWGRIKLISSVYDRLSELAAAFNDRKGIELSLDQARLDQQKDDPEKSRTFFK